MRGKDPRTPSGGEAIALVGCFATPHPPIIVPEVGGTELENAQATVRAMEVVRRKAASLHPDTIVLLSPHARLLRSRMGVSLAAAYEGTLGYFGAPEVAVEVDADEILARTIFERASESDIPVAATCSPEDTVDLDHGSMVPLVYVLGEMKRPCRLVLLSFSLLDLQEHVRFGETVGEVILEAKERILYVASSDLSHRLLPGAPAGFDSRGSRFDKLVADYFAAGDWRGLLTIDPDVAEAAGECGYRSLAVLSGVVAAAQAAGAETRNELLSYEGPFGVGYMVGEVVVTGAMRTQGATK